MSEITKAVIPAAGRGTRMKPISSYLPKPMLPLVKKPVLHHIVDELKGAGIEEIAIVARTDHTAIFEYFRDYRGIHMVEDDSASGPGGAILKARNFVDEDEFIVVFSDAPLSKVNRADHLRSLCKLRDNREVAAILSIYQIPASEVSSRGIIALDEQAVANGEPAVVTNIIEKPAGDDYPSRWAATCRYVVGPGIFDALQAVSSADGELQLTTAIQYFIAEGKTVLGLSLPDHLQRYDTGNFEGYIEAFRDFAE